MQKRPIRLRPHHIGNIITTDFLGVLPDSLNDSLTNRYKSARYWAGYKSADPLYGRRLDRTTKEIARRIIEEPNTPIEIIPGLDDICYACKKKPCPCKLRECGQEGPADASQLKRFNLQYGTTSASELLGKLRKSQEERGVYFPSKETLALAAKLPKSYWDFVKQLFRRRKN